MAISSPGVGSGLDVNSIVTQLVAIEKKPLQALATKATTFQTQLSLYGTINSQVYALQTTAEALTKDSVWSTQKATSSNATAVSVTAGSATEASSMSLDVTQLARAQSFTSVPVTAGTTVASAGTLSIQLGSWSGSTFTGSNTAVDVSISAGDSVAKIASAINRTADVGVIATRLWDQVNQTERLLITSKSTGEAAGFQIVAPGGTDLSKYGYTNVANTVSATSAAGVEGASVSQTFTDAKAAFATYTDEKKLFDDYPAAKLAYDDYPAAKLAYDDYPAAKLAYDDYIAQKQAYDNYPAAKSVHNNYLVTKVGYDAATGLFKSNYETAASSTYATYQEALDAWLSTPLGVSAPPIDPYPLGSPTDPGAVRPADPAIVANPGSTRPVDPGATRPADPGAARPAEPAVVTNPNPSASAGTLSIQLGTWAGATFKGSSTTMDIGVAVGDTFAQIAAKVNAAFSGATSGVVATVETSAGEDRLKFSYRGVVGEATGFRIANVGADLAKFALDGKVAVADVGSSQLGQDAKVKVNGVDMAFASNNLVDITPGVTLKLNQVGSADITVEADKDAIQAKIQALADSYSALNKTLSDSTKYVSGGKSGVLQGDSTTVGLQSLLRRVIGSDSVGSTLSKLSQAGLQLQTDGSLKLVVDVQATGRVDNLKSAMGNMANLQKLFTTNNSDSATNGFALKLRDMAKGMLSGTVTNKTTALQGSITRNGKDQERVTGRAAMVETQLRKQYSALDAQMAKMSGLSSYVTAQLAQWNKTS
jgi:flagellar hook-associated protein 2